MQLAPYERIQATWPTTGRHVLATYDDESVVVYQAYAPSIGRFAATHGYFGGDFSLSRMSWVKPNFLWMMYRSGWGTKEGQEITLAVRIQRSAFDSILAAAVPSSFDADRYPSRDAWSHDVARERENVRASRASDLCVPAERVYPVAPATAARLRISPP